MGLADGAYSGDAAAEPMLMGLSVKGCWRYEEFEVVLIWFRSGRAPPLVLNESPVPAL